MSLIRQDPENDKYWIYLYLYTKNAKALFKAYDINPGNSLVLNYLIVHYYRSKDFVKFFRAIQMAQKINHFNPNVICILMLLNAQIAISDSSISEQARNEFLLEAISIVQTISVKDIKDDFHMVQLTKL